MCSDRYSDRYDGVKGHLHKIYVKLKPISKVAVNGKSTEKPSRTPSSKPYVR